MWTIRTATGNTTVWNATLDALKRQQNIKRQPIGKTTISQATAEENDIGH